jgi:hypothetical protein
MKLKDALKQKITSKEQFDAILKEVSINNESCIGVPEVRHLESRRVIQAARDYYRVATDYWWERSGQVVFPAQTPFNLHFPSGAATNRYHHTRWWLVREHLRIALDANSVSEAMYQMVSRFPELAIHIKNAPGDEPTTVWYTPDPQAGERDAQVRTTLARLMRKLYPQTPDDVIRDVEALHRGEMSDEIEFISSDRIPEVYMSGDVGACMSKPPSYWSGMDDHHPTEAYDAPGFALAVSRNGSGDINARCLVWVNPDDPDDKRYVRNYGDTALEKKLQRGGYVLSGLLGARLKKIVLDTDDDKVRVVAPYIDYPNNSDRNPGGARSLVIDGDMLRVVEDALVGTRAKLAAAGVRVFGSGGTTGSTWIPLSSNMDRLNATCPITGQTFQPDGSNLLLWRDGRAGVVSKPAEPQLRERYYEYRTYLDGMWSSVWSELGLATYAGGATTTPTIDNAANRRADGFVLLSDTYYPENKWTNLHNTFTCAEGRVLNEDGVMLVTLEQGHAVCRCTHKAEMGAAKWRKLHRKNIHYPMYAAMDVPVVRTASGRAVVVGVHGVVEKLDGAYDFHRNVVEKRYMGLGFYTSRGVDPTAEVVAAAIKEEILTQWTKYLTPLLASVRGGSRTGGVEQLKCDVWFKLGAGLQRAARGALMPGTYGGYRLQVFSTYRSDTTDGQARARVSKSLPALAALAAVDPVPEWTDGVGSSFAYKLWTLGVYPALLEMVASCTDEILTAAYEEGVAVSIPPIEPSAPLPIPVETSTTLRLVA